MTDEEVRGTSGEVVDPPLDIEKKPQAKAKAGKTPKTGTKRKPAAKKSAAVQETTKSKATAKKGKSTVSAPGGAESGGAKTQTPARKKRVPKKTEESVQVNPVGQFGRIDVETYTVPASAPPVVTLTGASKVLAGTKQQVTVSAPETVVAQAAPAFIKIRNVDATLREITTHVIANKVIVQGLVHLQIFFVAEDEMVHHLAEDVAFSTFVDIPGAAPGMRVIVQPSIAAVFTQIKANGTILEKIIILDVFVKVVEDIQVNPQPGTGPVLLLQQVVGEGTVQTLHDTLVTLAEPAVKVEEIRGEIRDVTTEIIPNKVIVQGTIHKQIFFVGTDNIARHQAEEIHFSAFLDLPGVQPGMSVRVQPRIEVIVFELLTPTTLREKVVIENFMKVTTAIEFQAALGEGPLFRVPEIIGEGQGQILRRDVVTLDRPASTIREITAVLRDLRSHVIPGKAILQGTIHKQIYYIGPDEIEFHQAEDVPFSIMVDIPGASSGMDLVAEPVIEQVIFHLLSPTELEEKVILQARLIVVEHRQLRLVLGAEPLVAIEQVVGENLRQVLVKLTNAVSPFIKRVVPVEVVQTVQGEMVFTEQSIVENQVELPVVAVKIAEVSAEIQDLRATVIPGGLLVEGNVVKDITFVGEDDMVRNITEVVPFSLIISIPSTPGFTVQSAEVQIEQILFSISADGLTVRQIIVLKATAMVVESTTEQFQLISIVEVPGLNVTSVLVEEPVLTPAGVVLQQFPVITGLSGPGLALVESSTFSLHTLHVVGDGEQTLNVLEAIVVDP